jgi:hypothetical protein
MSAILNQDIATHAVAEAHLKDGKYTLPLGVAYCAEAVTRYGAGNQAGDVGDNEPQRTAANAANHAPELARWAARVLLSKALLAHHLLEHVAKLRVLSLLSVAAVVGEVVPRPRVGVTLGGAIAAGLGWDLFLFGVREGVRGCWSAAEELPLGVVVSTTPGVGECVVGVVDELKLSRPLGTLRRVRGDSVWVRLQGSTG